MNNPALPNEITVDTHDGDARPAAQADIRIVQGNPTETEVAALAALVSTLAHKAAAQRLAGLANAQENMWGAHDPRLEGPVTTYHPRAFQNVTFY